MKNKKFSMTMMVMDKTWLYSFGGATLDFHHNLTGFEIERLNTHLIGNALSAEGAGVKPDALGELPNEEGPQWERFVIKTAFQSCC